MKTWVITRTSAGYGELREIVVRAENLEAARLLIMRENRHVAGVTDFLDDDYSTAVLIADDAKGIISQSFSAS